MRRGAFDRPGLGLVLQLIGLTALPTVLQPTVLMIVERMFSAGSVVMACIALAVVALQIGAGLAMTRRQRGAMPLFMGYAVASVAMWIASSAIMSDLDASMIAGAAVESLGIPLLLAVVAVSCRDSENRSAGDLGALLAVLALTALLSNVVSIANDIRGGAGWWTLPRVGFGVLAASLELAAAIALIRSGWPAARRKLLIYVWVTIVGEIAFATMGLVSALSMDRTMRYLIAVQAMLLVLAPLGPVIKWRYARGVSTDDHDRRRRGTVATLGWLVLVLAPSLAGRAWMMPRMTELSGSQIPKGLAVLCAALAMTNTIAGIAAIRGARATYVYAWASVPVAVTLAISMEIWILRLPMASSQSMWSIALVLASSVALAVLATSNRNTPMRVASS